MNKYEQPQLFTSDPAQDEIATLKAQLRQLETENTTLRAEKRHWQIASEFTEHGGYGEMIGHTVQEDGIYIKTIVNGQGITVFVDKAMALDCGWMDKEEEEA